MSHSAWVPPEVAKLMVGKKIMAVRRATDAEEKSLYGLRPIVIEMEGGNRILVMSDDEGNEEGSLMVL